MKGIEKSKNTPKTSKLYTSIYDLLISRVYDKALKLGLTPIGESILRISVYQELKPYISRQSKIMDCCCGTGTLTILLTKLIYKTCRVYGIDISYGQIRRAKEKNTFGNLVFKKMDANKLEFEDDSFDIVVISAALHEMKRTQRLNVLHEIYRVLKNDGILLIFEHHEPIKPFKRVLFYFYLGFWENLFSHSLNLQRSLFAELHSVRYKIISQRSIHKFLDFFQIILAEKEKS